MPAECFGVVNDGVLARDIVVGQVVEEVVAQIGEAVADSLGQRLPGGDDPGYQRIF